MLPLLLLAFVICASASPGPFAVRFSTQRALGLRLSPALSVQGFHREAGGPALPAEATGWLRAGDVLLSVNGASVEGASLTQVSQLIRGAALPKELVFMPAGGASEDRADAVAAVVDAARKRTVGGRTVGTGDGPPRRLGDGAAAEPDGGTLEVSRLGAPLLLLPYASALFGPPLTCRHTAALVAVDPPEGCAAYRNAAAVAGAFALVRRGGCTFVHKALLAADAGARALLVANTPEDEDEGEGGGAAIRMPAGSDAAHAASVPPSVMVSSAAGRSLQAALGQLSPAQHQPRGAVTLRVLRSRDGVACSSVGASSSSRPLPSSDTAEKSGAAASAGRRDDAVPVMHNKEAEDDDDTAGGELLVRLAPAALQLAAAAPHHSASTPQPLAGARHALSGYWDDSMAPSVMQASRRVATAASVSAGQRAARGPEARARVNDGESLSEEGSSRLGAASGGNIGPAVRLHAEHSTDGSDPSSPVAARVEYLRAHFGPSAAGAPSNLELRLTLAIPSDACSLPYEVLSSSYAGSAVLTSRGGCSFSAKWAHAAAGGASMLLVANTGVGISRMQRAGTQEEGALEAPTAVSPMAVMVTDTAGRELRRLLLEGASRLANVTVRAVPRADTARHWAQLGLLLQPITGVGGEGAVWPREDAARRKAYTRLARTHHPDKPSGNSDRFDALRWAFAAANHAFAPERFPPPGEGA